MRDIFDLLKNDYARSIRRIEPFAYEIHVNGLPVRLIRKNIKNIHLAVYPPDGAVRVSAPFQVSEDRIRYYILSKMVWIKKQIANFQAQAREEEREFLNMETHMVWGEQCLLEIHANSGKNQVCLDYKTLHIYLKDQENKAKMSALLLDWHKNEVILEAGKRLAFWGDIPHPPALTICARKMKTRWGTCLPTKNKIILNSELAKKPRECLNYVLAHELTHFSVANHGPQFRQLMDMYLPNWKITKNLLNSLPLAN